MQDKQLRQLQQTLKHKNELQQKEILIDKIKEIQKSLLESVPTKQQLFAVYHLIINQVNLVYSLRELCISLIYCLCSRKKKNLLKGNKEHQNKEYYYRKGTKKLDRDLDVVNLIDLVKGYRVMQ